MSITEDHKPFENTQGKEDSQVYELGYLVLPSIPEENLSQVVDSIKKVITDNGGQTLDGEDPIKTDLAYAMSKVVGSSKYVVNDAYIGWMKFEAGDAEEDATHPVEVIKKEVEKISEILRFLLIKSPRESAFTFAKALEAKEERENPKKPEEDEAESDAEANDEVASTSEEVVE